MSSHSFSSGRSFSLASPRSAGSGGGMGAGGRSGSIEDLLPRMDFPLLGAALLLTLGGLLMVYEASGVMASKYFKDSWHFFVRQGIFALTGIILMTFLALLPLQRIYKATYPLLIVTMLLLLATIATPLGVTVNGATRWISLGFFNLQPMEIAKFSLVLYLAWFFSSKQLLVGTFSVGVVPPFAVTGVFCLLTLLQPDFGGAAVMTMLLFLICLVGGTRFIYLAGSVIMAGCAGAMLILHSPYRLKRFTAFLDPFDDPLNTGYQLVQSLYALGAGGFWGQGLGNSKQKLFFLPEAHNDFIMAVIGEELGFVGVTAVFLLMGLLIWRCFRVTMNLEDLRDKLTAYGLTLILALGAVLNMAVVLGAAPPKGVPMPFLSYGGSNLLANFACVGLILNLSRHARSDRR